MQQQNLRTSEEGEGGGEGGVGGGEGGVGGVEGGWKDIEKQALKDRVVTLERDLKALEEQLKSERRRLDASAASDAAVAGEVVGLQEVREENAELKRLVDDFLQVSNETQAELKLTN